MSGSPNTLRICPQGHRYYKSSSCPVCPICEKERFPEAEFLKTISAPARRALEREGILSLKKLASFTEKEILAFHGIGPGSLPPLRDALTRQGLQFSPYNGETS